VEAFAIVIAVLILGGAASVFASISCYPIEFDHLGYAIASETRDSNSVPMIFEMRLT
jgi:hypothetical protein